MISPKSYKKKFFFKVFILLHVIFDIANENLFYSVVSC